MKEITIQDIANVANVSKSTVSRVLNDTSAVHPDKRRAVLDATQRLGFKPNIFARGLASGRSMTIGVVTQIIGSPFYDSIAQGVIAGFGDTGYSPIFVDGQWEVDVEIEAIRALRGRRVDGLVLVGGNLPASDISRYCGELPTIHVARELPADEHHCVFMDNVKGGYCATKHLVDLGHRDIALIHGIEHHSDAINRFAGYRKALQEAGIEFDASLVLPGDFSADSGVKVVEQLLESGKTFSAIFAQNDMMAFGARLALDRHGKRVPDDVSIIGFDDQAEAAFMTPPLTSVRQPAREMGMQASQSLLKLINGESFEAQCLEFELKVRESAVRLG